jgi:hypothetical protein
MWRAALAAADAGARGTPKTTVLLKVMAKDHPRNDDLAALSAALDEAAER